MLHDVVVVWPGCTRECALVWFSIPNMSQHVATEWPMAHNLLRCVVLNRCDCLAGACKFWANNIALCCAEMLQSFGRSSWRSRTLIARFGASPPQLSFPLVYNKLYRISQNILAFWLFLTNDLLEDRRIDGILFGFFDINRSIYTSSEIFYWTLAQQHWTNLYL